jgi:hypothetical protein
MKTGKKNDLGKAPDKLRKREREEELGRTTEITATRKQIIRGFIQSTRTESITKYMLTTINTR